MSLERPHHPFSEIAEEFAKSASPKNTNRIGQKSASPFSLRLTEKERALLNERAENQPGLDIYGNALSTDSLKKDRIRSVVRVLGHEFGPKGFREGALIKTCEKICRSCVLAMHDTKPH